MPNKNTRIQPGEVHGELTAIRRIPRGSGDGKSTQWLCKCSCGNEKIISGFRQSVLISCGCVTPTGRKYIRSGKSNTPLYWVWRAMIDRCNNPENPAFHCYGGRGIVVCDRWLNFPYFLADVGERPGNLEIDRVDNDGPYAPNNFRWATRKEQLANKRGGRDERTGRFTKA